MRLAGESPNIDIATLLKKIRSFPSVLCQLNSLSSLRDPNSGLYGASGSREPGSRSAADEVFRSAHKAVFARWLDMTRADREADFCRFLSIMGLERSSVLSTWKDLETYRSFISSSATLQERKSFLASMISLTNARQAPASGLRFRLGTAHVARRLGVTQRTIRNWARHGYLPAVKAGKQWRFNPDEIEAWLVESGALPRGVKSWEITEQGHLHHLRVSLITRYEESRKRRAEQDSVCLLALPTGCHVDRRTGCPRACFGIGRVSKPCARTILL